LDLLEVGIKHIDDYFLFREPGFNSSLDYDGSSSEGLIVAAGPYHLESSCNVGGSPFHSSVVFYAFKSPVILD